MCSRVRKKISTGISNTSPTPRVTLTNRSKYSVIVTNGAMPLPRPDAQQERQAEAERDEIGE